MSDPLLTPAFLRLMGAQALQSLGYASMILFPRYLDAIGATRAQVGMVMASTAVGGLLTRPLVGRALDRLGRRPTLTAGTLALALGMAALGTITSVGPAAVLAAGVVGIGTGTLFTGYFAFASDLVPATRRTEGLALFGVAGLLPLAVNPLVTRAGLDPLSVRWFMPVVGLSVLASLLLLRGVPEVAVRRAVPEAAPTSLVRVLSRRSLWSVWLASVVFSGMVAAFMAFAVVVAEHRGLPDAVDVWLAYALASVSVRLVGSWLPQAIGPARLLALTLLSYIAGVAGLAVVTTTPGLWVVGALAGVGHGFSFPIMTAQVVDRTPEAVRGSALATFTGLWDLTKLLAPPALGALADAQGDEVMIQALVAVALVGLAGWAALEPGGQRVAGQAAA